MTQITERAAFIQWAVEVERVGEMAAAHAWDNGHLGAKAWQATSRSPAAQVPQQALALLRWAEFLLATSRPMTGQQQEAWPNLQKAADEMRILQRVALAAAPQPPEVQMRCWCLTCRPVRIDDPGSMRMALCPDCGNKRCPKANDHGNACTGSNDPGQPGSAYPAVQGITGDPEARKPTIKPSLSMHVSIEDYQAALAEWEAERRAAGEPT